MHHPSRWPGRPDAVKSACVALKRRPLDADLRPEPNARPGRHGGPPSRNWQPWRRKRIPRGTGAPLTGDPLRGQPLAGGYVPSATAEVPQLLRRYLQRIPNSRLAGRPAPWPPQGLRRVEEHGLRRREVRAGGWADGRGGRTGCFEERPAGHNFRGGGCRRARFLRHLPPLLIRLWM